MVAANLAFLRSRRSAGGRCASISAFLLFDMLLTSYAKSSLKVKLAGFFEALWELSGGLRISGMPDSLSAFASSVKAGRIRKPGLLLRFAAPACC